MWYMGQASRVIPREIRAVIYTFFGFLGNEKYRKESLRKKFLGPFGVFILAKRIFISVSRLEYKFYAFPNYGHKPGKNYSRQDRPFGK